MLSCSCEIMIDDFIRELITRFRPLPAHKRLVDTFCSGQFPITVGGIRKLPLAAVISDLFRYSKGSFLINLYSVSVFKVLKMFHYQILFE